MDWFNDELNTCIEFTKIEKSKRGKYKKRLKLIANQKIPCFSYVGAQVCFIFAERENPCSANANGSLSELIKNETNAESERSNYRMGRKMFITWSYFIVFDDCSWVYVRAHASR